MMDAKIQIHDDYWLNNYIIQINSDQKPAEDPIVAALTAVRGQLAGLQLQQ